MRNLHLTLALGAAVLAAACGGQNVSPPDHSDEAAPARAASSGAAHAPTGNRLGFDPPEGWVEEAPDSPMRAAQYRIPVEEGEDLELAVFFFGRNQGGDIEANLARWVGQFPDAGEPQRFELTTPVGPVVGIEIAGTWSPGPMSSSGPRADSRMLAAVVQTPKGNRFVRLVGDDAAVAERRDEFRAFLSSARWRS